MWNVKAVGTDGIFRGRSDLIETLWNVKCIVIHVYPAAVIDLIETLWNVKLYRGFFSARLTRFNRDIVECKVTRNITRNMDSGRFNRDIVECKEPLPSFV